MTGDGFPIRQILAAGACVALMMLCGSGADAQLPARSHGKVTIYRDAKGVPHVVGRTSAAVMFGLGYALAQDRLAQMELNRRAAQGRRAEVLGASAVAVDITARDRLLESRELMRMYAAIPQEHQIMMQSFVDGINRQIEEIKKDPEHKTPYEFTQWGIQAEPWTLLDFLGYVASVPNGRESYALQNLAFLKAMIARYGEETGREIFEDVVPLSDPDSPTTIPPGEDLAPAQPMPLPGPYPVRSPDSGRNRVPEMPAPPAHLPAEASRCLVIGPTRSASGHVLMMEATADGPESHLYGGGFDTAGFSFPGWGPPFIGRSLQHGWLMTSGQSDTTTTYAERLNPQNQYQYWFKGSWKDMDRRSETIVVKGGKPVVHEVALTIHGPVVHWDVTEGVAYTERYAERGHELDNWVGIVELARAKNLADFEAKGISRIAWNLGVCYGDTSGQFGFWEAGLLPKLPAGIDSRLPTPGTGEYEWQGYLSAAEHPHMLNPKQGFIHTWNSKATRWSREGDDARIGKAFRTWEGSELAASGTGITLLDMREINRKIFNALGAVDRTATSPAFFAPYIRAAVARTDDPEVKRAAELMLSFNGLYEDLDRDGKYDNAGLTLFRAWLEIAPKVIFGPDIGDWWSKIDTDRYLKYQTSLLLRALEGNDAGLPLRFDYFNGRDHDAVIVQTIRETIDSLRPQFAGQDMADWRLPVFWKYFDSARQTPDRPALPGTVPKRARTSALLGLGPYLVKHHGGEEWVGLMELTPAHPVLYSVVEAGGQDLFIDPSGKGNPHLTDQTMMHAENEFKRIVMSIDDVKRAAASADTLEF
jgi:acyl-homoserine lactone acylase PvdQ